MASLRIDHNAASQCSGLPRYSDLIRHQRHGQLVRAAPRNGMSFYHSKTGIGGDPDLQFCFSRQVRISQWRLAYVRQTSLLAA